MEALYDGTHALCREASGIGPEFLERLREALSELQGQRQDGKKISGVGLVVRKRDFWIRRRLRVLLERFSQDVDGRRIALRPIPQINIVGWTDGVGFSVEFKTEDAWWKSVLEASGAYPRRPAWEAPLPGGEDAG